MDGGVLFRLGGVIETGLSPDNGGSPPALHRSTDSRGQENFLVSLNLSFTAKHLIS